MEAIGVPGGHLWKDLCSETKVMKYACTFHHEDETILQRERMDWNIEISTTTTITKRHTLTSATAAQWRRKGCKIEGQR